MAKKKFLIAMDEDLHRKLKYYADEGEVYLGDAIGILIHHAETRVDLARLKEDLPYQDEWKQKPAGKFDSMLFHSSRFTVKDQAELYQVEDKKGIKSVPRPYFPFYGKRVPDGEDE